MSESFVSRRGLLGGGAGLAALLALGLAGCDARSARRALTQTGSVQLGHTNAVSHAAHGSAAPAAHHPSTPGGAPPTTAAGTPPQSSVPPPAATSSAQGPPPAPHTPTHTPTHTAPPPPSSTPPSSTPPPSPPPGAIAKVSDVPIGGSISASSNGKPVTLARPDATTAVGFSAICTHLGCTVNAGGPQLHCPCHGSIFNAFTGAVVQGPAPSPLPAINVAIEGGYIVAT